MEGDEGPFRRWMSTLRRRGSQRTTPQRRHHRKSDSIGSSIAWVTGVNSASITIAGTSIAPPSSHATANSAPASLADEAARHRSRKRREKIEELIRTEEGYIADLRALSNVRKCSSGYKDCCY